MADEIKFDEVQQAFVDKLVGEARVKARELAKAEFDKDAAKAKDTTDKAALAAQQQWQTLAQQHEARAKQLEPLEAQVKVYEEMVADMLKAEVKRLGDAAKKAIDALPAGMTAVEKLDWLNKNEGLFQVATGQGVGTPGRPVSPSPKGTGAKGPVSKYPIRL